MPWRGGGSKQTGKRPLDIPGASRLSPSQGPAARSAPRSDGKEEPRNPQRGTGSSGNSSRWRRMSCHSHRLFLRKNSQGQCASGISRTPESLEFFRSPKIMLQIDIIFDHQAIGGDFILVYTFRIARAIFPQLAVRALARSQGFRSLAF